MVLRDGFEIAAELAGIDRERAWLGETVGVRDASHLRLVELEAGPSVIDRALGPDAAGPGMATGRDGAWWCRLHPGRLLVIGPTGPIAGALDVTSSLAGVRIAGPLARETIARFCALDLREGSAPVGALRPGSVGRTPGIVLREARDSFLVLFGWAYSDYLWGVAVDAAQSLGGGGVGADA
jgi:heterotetrameric sarcosine oxidase gamma subunit